MRANQHLLSSITEPDGSTISYGYDSTQRLTSVTYPDNTRLSYQYAAGVVTDQLSAIIDENGNTYATFAYDAIGRATGDSLAGGVDTVSIVYNSDTSATITDALGSVRTFNYQIIQGRPKIEAITGAPCPQCAAGAVTIFDNNGYLQGSQDWNGNVTAYTFDANGLETQRIEAQGSQVERTINSTWEPTLRNLLKRTVLDAQGNLTAKTDWVYNTRGQVLAHCEDDPTVSGATSYTCSNTGTTPAGVRRWTYTYCNAVGGQCPLIGLQLSVDGPRIDVSDVTEYAYYQTTNESGCGTTGGVCHRAGDLWRVTNAVNQTTTINSYDKNGRITEITDPDGVLTDFTYTPRGWLHTRTVAGATTIIDYDAVGDVIKVTQPDGVFTTYTYDEAHRLISIGDALGNHIDFTLDAAGNRLAENTYAAGSSIPSRSLSRVYNTLGQLVKDLDAYAHATMYAYDPNGNRTGATDALDVTTHVSYDALNRLSQTVRDYLGTDPTTANTTTVYAYDSHDNVSQLTDPDGLVTHYYHDGLNDIGQLLSPDTGTTNYTYDAAGNRIRSTDARGVVTIYTYNALNRLTLISYPTATLDVHFLYSQANSMTGCASSYPINRLTEMTDATGSTTYCYDAHGNVILKRQVIAGNTYTTTYTYNAANRLMGVTYPDGASVTYTRDADGRVASVAATPVGGIATAVIGATTYLPFGPATSYSLGGGSQTLTKTYDSDYRATDITGSALNLHFKLNAVGDIVAEGDGAGVPTPNESYVYDSLYRLQQVDDATGAAWQTYTYNKTGDRLSKATTGLSPADAYSYQSGTHRLIGISGYDVSNRTMDANGNTTSLQANGWSNGLGYNDANRLAVVQQNGTTVATYGLNGVGERTVKTLAGGGTQAYVYGEGGRLLGEYATGQSRDYVWADGTLVAILDNPAQGGDTIHYIYTDNLGTPRAVTTQAGTTIWDWPYTQNTFGERAASGNAYTLNLRYPGQYFDQETGLHYNYFRDYEPGTGRYAQSDRVCKLNCVTAL